LLSLLEIKHIEQLTLLLKNGRIKKKTMCRCVGYLLAYHIVMQLMTVFIIFAAVTEYHKLKKL
jgi:hypothetical protein